MSARRTGVHQRGAPATKRPPDVEYDTTIFTALAVVAAIVVMLEFGLELVGAPSPHARPRGPLVMVHAGAFVAWIVLFGVQTDFIATHSSRLRQLHRQTFGVQAGGSMQLARVDGVRRR